MTKLQHDDMTYSDGKERVLVVHNAYQQRGGEDSVVESEVRLLEERGHEVAVYSRDNHDVGSLSGLHLAAQTIWSVRTRGDIRRLVRDFRPDVVHAHNTFPLISPSLYWEAAAARIPVIQTLHNFRLLCPQGLLLRDGRICRDCVGHVPWRAALHSCYRDSLKASAAAAGMMTAHRVLGTWSSKVDRYIALNDFCREQFVAGGLPRDRICVKPNFVDVPAPGQAQRRGFLFVGRLSKEKGVGTLAAASAGLAAAERVSVIGEGPESGLFDGIARVDLLGARDAHGVLDSMTKAAALVIPSIWYENFPRTLVESFACGLPVIASRLGALETLIDDGINGLLFIPGDAADLAAKLSWAAANPQAMSAMGQEARRKYERLWTGDRNYDQLLAIYREAISSRKMGAQE